MVTVVCTGGESPPSSRSLAWLDACQRIVAADGGLTTVRILGRRADLWIGDGDSLEGPVAGWSEWYAEARLLETEKDDTDTEAAVRASVEAGASEVWLLGGSGGRMDHWWANLRLVQNQPKVTRWLTGREEIWSLGPGQRLSVPGGTVSIFPLGTGPWSLGSQGLRWPLDGVDFSTWHSLSNHAGLSGAEITVDAGRVLVMQPFVEKADP